MPETGAPRPARPRGGALESRRNIAGGEPARGAATEDAVDGVAPSFVVEPGSTEDISELMKLANDRNIAVAPRGGGTSMALGNPPRELGLILSTTRMNAVVEHGPAAPVVTAQRGSRR